MPASAAWRGAFLSIPPMRTPLRRSPGAKRSISRSSARSCRSAAASPTCSRPKEICCSVRRSAPRVSSRAKCSRRNSCSAATCRRRAIRSCDAAAQAIAVLRSGEFAFPVVLKADGLAAGKGVVISPRSRRMPSRRCTSMMVDKRFGQAGARARHRGAARRARSVVLRAERRHARAAARIGRGSQARARRRSRARTPAAWARTRRARCSMPPPKRG